MTIYDATLQFVAAVVVATSISAQYNPTPLDDYINSSETIVVAKCAAVGAVNILMRASVDLEILHVVKGKADLKTLTVESQYGMTVGQRYLVRIAKSNGEGGRVNDRSSVIPVSSSENIETLKSLSARIIVLRTMNMRIDQLESDIRIKTFEMEALQAIKKGN